ncbi:MAG: Lin0512 family protein [Chloroflexi bacterium]|nr:Lin0512 family protein [Chloroflexota bacterium]
MRTFVVEMGTGVDLHGQDPTKAAVRAVRNCFQHLSLPGLRTVAGVDDVSKVEVEVVLAAPPEAGEIDVAQVKAQFPFGQVRTSVQPGGLFAAGEAFRPDLGDRVDMVLMVNALIYVRVP